MNRPLLTALMALVLTSCVLDDPELEVSSTDQALTVQSWAIWRSPNIPVCFDNGGTAEERRWVREALRDTWEAVSSVRFINWNNCSFFNSGVRVYMSDSRGYTAGIGIALDGLAFGVNLDAHLRADSCPLGTREACVRASAVHEFGHVLGFPHEQSRADTPADCTDSQGIESEGDRSVGAWDLSSVMNYCNPMWNNGGFLSPTDVIGVRQYYGTQGRWTDPRVFDATFYRTMYPDAGADNASATVHWLSQGLPLLGRRGSRTFDVEFYLGLYADLRDAFANRYNRVVAHWQDFGIFEGRRGSREFESWFYELTYPDVPRDHLLAMQHWIDHGLPDGRRGSREVDVQYYTSHYLDVQSASGGNRVAALDHFIKWGLLSGRRASIDFDVAYYLAAYADVRALVGTSYTGAFDHWVRIGRAEERFGVEPSIAPPPRPPIICRPGRC